MATPSSPPIVSQHVLQAALAELRRRQEGTSKPDGYWTARDPNYWNVCAFVPAPGEWAWCCAGKADYGMCLFKHCRTSEHVAALFHCPPSVLKAVARGVAIRRTARITPLYAPGTTPPRMRERQGHRRRA